jgi:hypothetical protein
MPKRKYPDNFYEAFKSIDASKVLIKSLYEELTTIRQSLVNSQDELENWKNKYHASDKRAGILNAQIRSSVLAEIMKFLLSTVLAGVGINLLTDGAYWIGGGLAAMAILCYVGIVALSKHE